MAVLSILLAGCAVAPRGEPREGNASPVTDALADALVGEYTNHAQVWAAQRADEPAPPAYLVTISPLAGTGKAEVVLRYRLFRAGESASPVRDARFLLSPGPEGTVIQAVQRRERGEWRSLAGCRVIWERRGSEFRGRTRGDGCRFRATEADGEVILRRDWTVGPGELRLVETRESGGAASSITLAFEPVRWFTGWAGVRPRGDRASDDWRIERRIRLHDGGGERGLPQVEGRDYTLRLERLAWPRSGIRMLRLSVVEPASGDIVAYAWAPPDAESIGIHLGWLQAGFAAAEEGPRGQLPIEGGRDP